MLVTATTRPRQPIAEMLGKENQSLPVLVLGQGEGGEFGAKTANGDAFISNDRQIRNYVSGKFGLPAAG